MREACRERTFCGARLLGISCVLLALATLNLASCGSRDGSSAGDPQTSAPVPVKTETGIGEKDAIELAKKELLKSAGGMKVTDFRVTSVKAAVVQREPVWIVTFKHQEVVVPGDPLEVTINKRTGAAHLAPKK